MSVGGGEGYIWVHTPSVEHGYRLDRDHLSHARVVELVWLLRSFPGHVPQKHKLGPFSIFQPLVPTQPNFPMVEGSHA